MPEMGQDVKRWNSLCFWIQLNYGKYSIRTMKHFNCSQKSLIPIRSDGHFPLVTIRFIADFEFRVSRIIFNANFVNGLAVQLDRWIYPSSGWYYLILNGAFSFLWMWMFVCVCVYVMRVSCFHRCMRWVRSDDQ